MDANVGHRSPCHTEIVDPQIATWFVFWGTGPTPETEYETPWIPLRGPEASQVVVTLVTVEPGKLRERILRGGVSNVDFSDLVRLVVALGFREVGGRGSHRVFAKEGVAALINLQEERGQAKRYQVRQIAALMRRYDLDLEEER